MTPSSGGSGTPSQTSLRRRDPRGYRTIGHRSPTEIVEFFVERVGETGAVVVYRVRHRRGGSRAPGRARSVACDGRARPRRLAPPRGRGGRRGRPPPAALDALDGAVTTCAAACAETGTIAFDGGEGQGRRAITLVPDLHVCIVRPPQIVETVPELFDGLAPSARRPADRRRLRPPPPPTSSSSGWRFTGLGSSSSSCKCDAGRRRP